MNHIITCHLCHAFMMCSAPMVSVAHVPQFTEVSTRCSRNVLHRWLVEKQFALTRSMMRAVGQSPFDMLLPSLAAFWACYLLHSICFSLCCPLFSLPSSVAKKKPSWLSVSLLLVIGWGLQIGVIGAKCFIRARGQGPSNWMIRWEVEWHLCHGNVKHIMVQPHNAQPLHSFRAAWHLFSAEPQGSMWERSAGPLAPHTPLREGPLSTMGSPMQHRVP